MLEGPVFVSLMFIRMAQYELFFSFLFRGGGGAGICFPRLKLLRCAMHGPFEGPQFSEIGYTT